MPASRTHSIPKRDLHFDFSKVDFRSWHPAGTQASHYFNVQSVVFPQGERFFIRSVRHFRDQVHDPVLRDQVGGFIAQEAMHGREHDAYNAALVGIGYRVDRMERSIGRTLWVAEKIMSPKVRLAMTVALEHMTAISAEDALADDDILDRADPEMARLWRWHALEETEHKAVAFDVYQEVTGNNLMAWIRRCLVMLLVSTAMQLNTWTFLFMATIRSGTVSDLRGWRDLFWVLWVKPGSLRRQFPRYWQFFKPGFHPWQNDNYHQVMRWQTVYGGSNV